MSEQKADLTATEIKKRLAAASFDKCCHKTVIERCEWCPYSLNKESKSQTS